MARRVKWRWSGYAAGLAGASLAHGAVLTGAAFIGVHAIQARERPAAEEPAFAVLVRIAGDGPIALEPPRGVELALSDAGSEEAELEPLSIPPELLLAAQPYVPAGPEPEADAEPARPDEPVGPVWAPEPKPEPAPEPVAAAAIPDPEPVPEPVAPPAAAPEPGVGPGPASDPLAAAAAGEPAHGSPGGGSPGLEPAAAAAPPGAGSAGAAAGSAAAGPRPGTADGQGSGAVRTRLADVRPPVPLARPDPEYPRLAQRLGEQGSVMCLLHVDAQGRVARVEVTSSSGHERLDEAAVQRLSTWTFRPATLDGAPVAATYRHRVRFELRP